MYCAAPANKPNPPPTHTPAAPLSTPFPTRPSLPSLDHLQASSRADIIAFYNQTFVPAMKAFLLKAEAGAAASGLIGASSLPSGLPAGLPPLPPRAASQSPRAGMASAAQPRLPPLSSAAAGSHNAPPRLPQGIPLANIRTAAGGGGGMSMVIGALGSATGPSPSSAAAAAMMHASQGDTPTGQGLAPGLVPGSATSGSSPGTPSGNAVGPGGAPLPPRPARAKSVEHKIHGGLAALLQALETCSETTRVGAAPSAAAEALALSAAAAAAAAGPLGIISRGPAAAEGLPGTPSGASHEGANGSTSPRSRGSPTRQQQQPLAASQAAEGGAADAGADEPMPDTEVASGGGDGMQDMMGSQGAAGSGGVADGSRRPRAPNRKYL